MVMKFAYLRIGLVLLLAVAVAGCKDTGNSS